MSLVDLGHFEPLFAPYAGLDVGFMTLDGNVGDLLINAAARELMKEFRVRTRDLQSVELDSGDLLRPVDAVFVSGGGNMGGMYPVTVRQRARALALGKPVTVLPQTFTDEDEDITPYHRVYVRERTSLARQPGTLLAPDLALGLRPPWIDEGVAAATGVWLRTDRERQVPACRASLGDPALVSDSVSDYLGLASCFEHVVTDRLHFAIASLLVGRKTTLLPNSYHKNRSLYETWLRDLGCRWRRDAGSISADVDVAANGLWKRLSTPPSSGLPWHHCPVARESWRLEWEESNPVLREGADKAIRVNAAAAVVWQLCNGEWSVEDMCEALSAQYERPILEIARDVQGILRNFKKQRLLKAEKPAKADAAPAVINRPVIDVVIDAPRRRQGRVRWSAHVSGTSRGRLVHYFDIDARWRHALTRRADPFVLALLPRAIVDGAVLRVRGAPVDARLLDHLDEYCQLHRAWWPERTRPIAIDADEVRPRVSRKKGAVSLFSGGLDSMYTLHRHRVAPDGRRNDDLEAVVMACGFDVPVSDPNSFASALSRLRPVTDAAGVPLIDVVTNVRTHLPNWERQHGPALASVLHLFAGAFDAGIIPSTAPYRLMFPWGSSPVGDPLLGGTFDIRHDSAAVGRPEKLRAVAQWPTGVERLRVCWANRRGDRNCGRCLKCCQLAVGLQALAASEACFDAPPSDEKLANYVERSPLKGLERLELSGTLSYAQNTGVLKRWVEVLEERLGTTPNPPVT